MKSTVLLLCFFVTCFGIDLFDTRPRTIRIHQLRGKCRGLEKVPIFWRDTQFGSYNRTYFISTKIVFQRNVDNDMKVDLKLEKCQSRDSLDSCEVYQNLQIRHICKLLNNEHTPWYPFVRNMHPIMRCPVKKGVYSISNGTFDGTAFNNLPFQDNVWKVQAKVRDDVTDEVLMCILIEFQTIPI